MQKRTAECQLRASACVTATPQMEQRGEMWWHLLNIRYSAQYIYILNRFSVSALKITGKIVVGACFILKDFLQFFPSRVSTVSLKHTEKKYNKNVIYV